MTDQILTLIIPIAAIIWLILSINQVRLNKVSRIPFIIYFMFGLFICILAALRDGYGFSESIIPLESITSTLLSVLGLLLFIIMIFGTFSKNQLLKTRLFTLMIIIFVSKFIYVELIMLGVLS